MIDPFLCLVSLLFIAYGLIGMAQAPTEPRHRGVHRRRFLTKPRIENKP